MVVLNLYSLPIKNTYRSFLLSKATVFVIIANVFNIILPFIFAYRSRGSHISFCVIINNTLVCRVLVEA